MVEEYVDKTRFYYKCNLCGAHGKVEPMLKHLLGDKHTDKYIVSSYSSSWGTSTLI